MHYLESCLEKQYSHEQSFLTSQLQTVIENMHSTTDQCTTSATDKLDKRLHSTLQRSVVNCIETKPSCYELFAVNQFILL